MGIECNVAQAAGEHGHDLEHPRFQPHHDAARQAGAARSAAARGRAVRLPRFVGRRLRGDGCRAPAAARQRAAATAPA